MSPNHRRTLGKWLVGDFSHVAANGVYQGCVGCDFGVTFAMRDDAWVRVVPECIRYFQVQSCGRDVPA